MRKRTESSPRSIQRAMDEISGKYGRTEKIVLALDFDGTLVPIQKDPAACVLPAEIRQLLVDLSRTGHCMVMILSGRALADIKKRVGIRNIFYGGNHGLDISGPGLRYTHPKALSARPDMMKFKKELLKKISHIQGAWIEDKKYTATLHYRAVRPHDVARLKKTFDAAARDIVQKEMFGIVKGKKVIELVPDESWNKGSALKLVLARLQKKILPVYIGDDITDETAFSALADTGITVRVGRSANTAARYHIRSYTEVEGILKFLLALPR